MCNFYRKFIRNFSGVCASMINTIKGGRKCVFSWTKEVNDSFKCLKKNIIDQPILVLPNFYKFFTVEYDVSNYWH